MKFFLSKSLQSGEIPYWCPNYFCGSPFISDIQSGVFYPLSLVFFLPFPWSLNLFILLHFFLGFCFFYLFIKEIGLSRRSAIITSISYCYGSYIIASVNTLNNLSTAIWLPAILWGFKKTQSKGQKSGYFLTAIFLCMAILGGEPELFILSGGLLLLVGSISFHGENGRMLSVAKNAGMILLLISSALLLTAVQIGPTYLDYQHSARLGGLSYEDATKFSLHWETLKHLIYPLRFEADFSSSAATLKDFFPEKGQVPWLLTLYPGFIIVPAAVFGLIFHFSKNLLLWLSTFLITLTLALGNATPVYYLFYRIFPVFRFPEKFLFLTSISLLVMAAYGFDPLLSRLAQKGVRPNLLFAFMALLLTADLYTTHRHLNPLYESDFYRYHHPYLQPILQDPEKFRVYIAPEIAKPLSSNHSILNHHIRWQMMLKPNLGILYGLDHVDGTPALELRYQYLMTEILSKPWREKILFLQLSNVKYIVSTQEIDRLPELKGRVERVNPLVYRIKRYLPRAWMLGQLLPIRTGTVDDLVHRSFDPASSALSKGEIINRYQRPFFKEIDHIRYERNNQVRITVTGDDPGILILSESSYPGWKVFVDGREKALLWLDLLFQGVEVEKGTHEILFLYRPKHFDLFLWISVFSLALFILCWAAALRSSRKTPFWT